MWYPVVACGVSLVCQWLSGGVVGWLSGGGWRVEGGDATYRTRRGIPLLYPPHPSALVHVAAVVGSKESWRGGGGGREGKVRGD